MGFQLIANKFLENECKLNLCKLVQLTLTQHFSCIFVCPLCRYLLGRGAYIVFAHPTHQTRRDNVPAVGLSGAKTSRRASFARFLLSGARAAGQSPRRVAASRQQGGSLGSGRGQWYRLRRQRRPVYGQVQRQFHHNLFVEEHRLQASSGKPGFWVGCSLCVALPAVPAVSRHVSRYYLY